MHFTLSFFLTPPHFTTSSTKAAKESTHEMSMNLANSLALRWKSCDSTLVEGFKAHQVAKNVVVFGEKLQNLVKSGRPVRVHRKC